VSALAWAGSWIEIGYLLTHGVAGLGGSFGISLALVIISAPLVGGQLRRQAPRRLLPHTVGRATAGNGLSAARRSPSSS
jgi:hypothetical protein